MKGRKVQTSSRLGNIFIIFEALGLRPPNDQRKILSPQPLNACDIKKVLGSLDSGDQK